MSTIASITTTREPKTTVNLCSEFMAFNEDVLYTVSSGSSNIEVSNSTEFAMYGSRSMKIRFLGTGEAVINLGVKSESTLKEAIRHLVSFDAYKTDETSDVTVTLESYLNASLVSELVCNMYSTSGFTDGQINTFFGLLYPLVDDVISFQLKVQCDTINTVIYLDGFKVEADRFALQQPSLYSEPPFKTLKWQQRSDFTNTTTLDANIETDFAFIGTLVEKNVDNDILDIAGFSVPTKLNTLITRSVNFTAVVPSGGDKYIRVKLLVNAVVVRESIHHFVLSSGSDEVVSAIFDLPVNQEVLENQCKIVLEPNASTDIKNRISLHKEVANA